MSGTRSVMGTVNRYVSLAGKSCCCGRSWVGLNASLARHGEDAGVATKRPRSPPAKRRSPTRRRLSRPASTDSLGDFGRIGATSPRVRRLGLSLTAPCISRTGHRPDPSSSPADRSAATTSCLRSQRWAWLPSRARSTPSRRCGSKTAGSSSWTARPRPTSTCSTSSSRATGHRRRCRRRGDGDRDGPVRPDDRRSRCPPGRGDASGRRHDAGKDRGDARVADTGRDPSGDAEAAGPPDAIDPGPCDQPRRSSAADRR